MKSTIGMHEIHVQWLIFLSVSEPCKIKVTQIKKKNIYIYIYYNLLKTLNDSLINVLNIPPVAEPNKNFPFETI
jgi:hypothetical protein